MDAKTVIGGIEGGATHSTIILLNSSGEIIVTAKGPGTNHFLLGMTECRKRIAGMVEDAKEKAGIPPNVPLDALGLSLSGCEHEDTNQELMSGLQVTYPNLSKQYAIGSDTEGSISVTSGQGGVVCISGTGSNTLLINPDGSRFQCGGWGYILGDEGSGYQIAKGAVKSCFDSQDGFKEPPHPIDAVWELVKQHFNVKDKTAILEPFYSNFDKAFIASLCKKLAGLAHGGDKMAKSLFEGAGRDLARALAAVIKRASQILLDRKGGIHILCVGSVWLSWDLLQTGFVDYIEKETNIKELSLMTLTTAMAVGAAYMAANRCNLTLQRHYERNYTVFYTYKRGGCCNRGVCTRK